MQIHVVENVLKLNDEMAAINRDKLKSNRVFTINLMGAPGSGKTALLETTLAHLKGRLRAAVAVGDLTTQRDATRLSQHCDQVVQINTGRGCHLDANHVRQALGNIELKGLDILFVENVGNLICPVGFDLGQTVKVGLFSISEGDDKAAKHPYLVKEAGLLLLNKIDLLPYITFNQDTFLNDVAALNPGVKLLELSVTKNTGLEPWYNWLAEGVKREHGNSGGGGN